jgi:hypothetical protein
MDPGLLKVREAKLAAMRRGEIERAAQAAEKQRQIAERVAEAQGQMNAYARNAAVAINGEMMVEYSENSLKYGRDVAGRIASLRAGAEASERDRRAREQAHEAEMERQRKAELEHEKALAAAAEQRKRQEDILLGLRRRVAEFGKSDLEIDRGHTLADITDPKLRFQAEMEFAKLEAQENVLKRRRLKERNEATLESRGPLAAMDARTAEGWAKLRENVRNTPAQLQLKQLVDQTSLLRSIDRKLGDDRKPEVFTL